MAEDSTITLRGDVVPIDLPAGQEFIVACVRNVEGLVSDADIRKKYDLSANDWRQLINNSHLHRAIREERERKIYNGVAPREAAQTYLVKAPAVLNGIMSDERAAPTSRVEASKGLHRLAGDPAQPSQGGERFSISINFGAQVKPVKIEVVNPQPRIGANSQPLLDSEPIEAPRPDEADA